MYILGISCYCRCASAALLNNGKFVAAAEEEIFTRIKNDTSFPVNAIAYCLKSEGISIDDIDVVGFYEKPLISFERALYQHIETFPLSFKSFLRSMPSWLSERLRLVTLIRARLRYKKDIMFLEHPLAHAGSFLISPYDKAAILIVDDAGEWTTTSYGLGKQNKIRLLKEIRFPSSLGLLYSAITDYLGFNVNDLDHEVMDLAAYGDMNKESNIYYNTLKKIIDIKEDGSYMLDMNYFSFHYSDAFFSRKLCNLLGGKNRRPGELIKRRHKDIAAALQILYEEILFKMLNYIYKQTNCKNIVISGACAFNGVANGKIQKNTNFKNIWIQPNSGDNSTSIGVASYIYYSILNNKRNFIMEDAYLGPEFSAEQIKYFLDINKIKYKNFDSKDELVKTTAKLIYENNFVGWFQGRIEFGPNALGNRSILSNPCNPKMKEILNAKIKHREKFRSLASVVCIDDAPKYFDCDNPIPEPADFMQMVYPIKKEYLNKLPAVTHVDGSGRLQTIRKEQNPLYYELIKEFGRISGFPVLINTSFSITDKPLVCSPYDAYKCFIKNELDYLVMDKFLIKRTDNPKEIWNTEGYTGN